MAIIAAVAAAALTLRTIQVARLPDQGHFPQAAAAVAVHRRRGNREVSFQRRMEPSSPLGICHEPVCRWRFIAELVQTGGFRRMGVGFGLCSKSKSGVC